MNVYIEKLYGGVSHRCLCIRSNMLGDSQVKTMKSILLLSSSMTRADWVCAEKVLQNPHMHAYILAYDRNVLRQMHRISDKVSLLDDYLPQSEWKNINKLATEWGMEWYLQPGLENKMIWSDIHLASIVPYPWHYTLNAIIRLCFVVNLLIDDQKPERIEFFLRDWKPMSIIVDDCDPLLEIVAKHVASKRDVKTVNHADGASLANTIYLARIKAKNTTRGLLQEASKLSRRYRTSVQKNILTTTKRSSPLVLFAHCARSILEITQALHESADTRSLWVAPDKSVVSSDIEYQELETRIISKLSPVYRRSTRLFAGQHAHVYFTLSDKNYFTAYNIDLLPVIDLWIKFLLRKEFPRLVLNIEAAEEIIRNYQPDAIFADNSLLETERILFLLAAKYNILTIEYQHGMYNNITYINFAKYYFTDWNIVWGKHDRDKQVSQGGDHSRFILGGNAWFDPYFRYLSKDNVSNRAKKQQLLRIGVTCKKAYKNYGAVGLLSMVEDYHAQYYRRILEAARKMPDVIFSFKTRFDSDKHPLLKDLIAEYDIQNYEIVQTINYEEWLSSISGLIMDYSTMGLEAMIFDVPVIILNVTGWPDPLGFESSDAVDVVANAEELYQALFANIQDPERRAKKRAEFVYNAVEDTEGMAAKRIARIITDLIRKRSIKKKEM